MTDFGIRATGPAMYSLSGELDLATVPLMNIAIADAVCRGGPIMIDVTELAFMDSTGVEAILTSVNALPTGCIVLHGVHDAVERVIDLMGVDGGLSNLHVIPCPHDEEPAVGDAIEAKPDDPSHVG
ncbi:MAG: STAS domain-containing protein [Actinomycetota bacterium]